MKHRLTNSARTDVKVVFVRKWLISVYLGRKFCRKFDPYRYLHFRRGSDLSGLAVSRPQRQTLSSRRLNLLSTYPGINAAILLTWYLHSPVVSRSGRKSIYFIWNKCATFINEKNISKFSRKKKGYRIFHCDVCLFHRNNRPFILR